MQIDVEYIKAEAAGRWPGIFQQLGVDVGEGKHQPCPLCQGQDRFRFDDKDGQGTYICNQCGAGNGWTLVQKYFNIGFIEAVKKVSKIIGIVEMNPANQKPYIDPSKALNRLWKASLPLKGSDPACCYLHSRGLVLQPDDVRYCPACYESDTKKELPAMVAMFKNRNGEAITLHRTYLGDRCKADIPSPKKIMPGKYRLNGGAVRLFPAKDNKIGIAEGIETAIACKQIFNVPTWAALTSTLMLSFDPPEGVREIVIFGDCDANFAGHKAAYTLANRLYLKDYLVSVKIPDKGDWADHV